MHTDKSFLMRRLLACLAMLAPALAQNQPGRDVLQELIELDTTHSTGDTTRAAEAMAARLQSAGFGASDMKVLGPHPRRGNLVVRYRGAGSRRPLLLLAHLDVVEARREDWSVDPFKLLERDGYFYGRGTGDDKSMAAIWIANLIRFKQENYRPGRDLIVALTADEESGGDYNGVEWLVKNHKDLIDAEYCLNEGGNGQLKNGKRLLNQVQVAEKATFNVTVEVRNKGGHSSMPPRENAIYRLGRALARLEEFEFPIKLNEVTREFFRRMSTIETGAAARDMKAMAGAKPDPEAARRLAASPFYNAQMRNTCVATRLEGGHADNALPQLARAVVNCRLLPGESPDETLRTLKSVIRDDLAEIGVRNWAKLSRPSPLDPAILRSVERATTALWPGVPVVPTMSTGGTDGRDLRNAGIPTYGVSGLFEDIDDIRWHGRDERVAVKAFFEAQEFLYRLTKDLAGQ
jgi:acetylornithine deacetylase/succinyl-diaminopimelate desuccinylase-like protein